MHLYLQNPAKSSDALLATRCCSVYAGVLFTSTISFKIRLIWFRSPVTLEVPIRSMATARAAFFPCSVVRFAPN